MRPIAMRSEIVGPTHVSASTRPAERAKRCGEEDSPGLWREADPCVSAAARVARAFVKYDA